MYETEILQATERLARNLARHQQRLVLAESCTAGNVAGALATIPGISNWLCGSFVVYRNDSKHQWLGIDQQLLDDPNIGPVSSQVTERLAAAALAHTPEATLAAAVTGHIGPGSPPHLDGRAFVSLRNRQESLLFTHAIQLTNPAPLDPKDTGGRTNRLRECTLKTLIEISVFIEKTSN